MSTNHTCSCGHDTAEKEKETHECQCGGTCGCTPDAEQVKEIAQKQAAENN